MQNGACKGGIASSIIEYTTCLAVVISRGISNHLRPLGDYQIRGACDGAGRAREAGR